MIHRSNLDGAIVIDVDLGAGHLANFANDFTAGTDNLTDLVLGDAHGGDPRRVGTDIIAGRLDPTEGTVERGPTVR